MRVSASFASRRFVVALIPFTLVFAGVAFAESELEPREERGKWRFSVGASVIGPVKSDLGVSGTRLQQLSGFGALLMERAAARRGMRSRAEAYAAGAGTAAGQNGVRRFDDGAWYDPHDSASASDPDWSWNWRLHDPTGPDPDGRRGFMERTSYFEEFESVSMATSDSRGVGSDDSEWFPGIRVEAARELYRSEGERPWGVDVASAFSYYFQRGLWQASGTAARASVHGRREEGSYEWWNDSRDTVQYILDYERDTQFHDGMWGAGSFEGPGAELESSAWNFRDVVTASEEWSAAHTLRYHGNGDYREYSIELLVRPWWEPWEWLRVFGSIGMEISRREFEWSLSASGTDGSHFSESGDACDWRVLGLLGGGFALQWHDFVLAGEALWRFGGDDLEVSGRTVHGGIKSGDWGFRLALGYEF